jgi:hypothetical protein
VSSRKRQQPPAIPRAIPRTGEDLARLARTASAQASTPSGRPTQVEVPPAERDTVYVGRTGTPDDDEFRYPPGTIVSAVIPW